MALQIFHGVVHPYKLILEQAPAPYYSKKVFKKVKDE